MNGNLQGLDFLFRHQQKVLCFRKTSFSLDSKGSAEPPFFRFGSAFSSFSLKLTHLISDRCEGSEYYRRIPISVLYKPIFMKTNSVMFLMVFTIFSYLFLYI